MEKEIHIYAQLYKQAFLVLFLHTSKVIMKLLPTSISTSGSLARLTETLYTADCGPTK